MFGEIKVQFFHPLHNNFCPVHASCDFQNYLIQRTESIEGTPELSVKIKKIGCYASFESYKFRKINILTGKYCKLVIMHSQLL
jgi:hypothetical protein